MISTLAEGLHMITTCCCSGTKWQCLLFLFFWMWRIFHGNRPLWLWAEIISCCYWQLLDRRLLWPDFSFFTPTSICAYCQKKRLASSSYWPRRGDVFWHSDSLAASWPWVEARRQSPHPDRMGCHFWIPVKFIMIGKAQWEFPEQRRCPCSDKWLDKWRSRSSSGKATQSASDSLIKAS